MKKRHYLLLVALTVIAGLAGGAISSQVFTARKAVAQLTQDHERVITAEQFQLVDKEGNMRVVIGMSPKRGPVLGFTDENGQTRIFLGLTSVDGETWPILKLRDADEDMRISISGGNGNPRISVLDKYGNSRAVLGCAALKAASTELVETKPESSISLFNEDGKMIWAAP